MYQECLEWLFLDEDNEELLPPASKRRGIILKNWWYKTHESTFTKGSISPMLVGPGTPPPIILPGLKLQNDEFDRGSEPIDEKIVVKR